MIPGHELIKVRERKKSESALLFVHGFTGDSQKTWQEFPRILGTEEDLGTWDIFSLGYNTSFLPGTRGVWAADPELPILATHFRTELSITPLASYKNLAIAAHSMGGLLVQRALVDDLKTAARVRQLFLFGAPSAGITKAAFFRALFGIFVGQQVSNMAADSEFIVDLRSRWIAAFGDRPPFALFAIAGDRDQFVPWQSSLKPFAPCYHRVIIGDHLSMVKPRDRDAESVRLMLTALRNVSEPEAPSGQLRLAAEIGAMAPEGVAVANAAAAGTVTFDNEKQLVQAALVLDAESKRTEAIELLQRHEHLGTDAKGTLAGRVKRRWVQDGKVADAEWALRLYSEALQTARAQQNDAQIFYHAINIAFFRFVMFDDPDAASEIARVALDRAQACESDPEQTVWSIATQAEACLYLGRRNDALNLYRRVPQVPGAEHWQLLSAGQQAQQVAGKLKDTALQKELKQLFDPVPPSRKRIFVSYSHRDLEWLTELQTVLKPYLTEWDTVDLWADTRIEAGSRWLDEIRKALTGSKVAVLMVSAEFLASDFIRQEELPVLLDAADKQQVQLIWMYLSPAGYETTRLVHYQAAHDLAHPLESLSKVERREVLRKVAFEIKKAVFE